MKPLYISPNKDRSIAIHRRWCSVALYILVVSLTARGQTYVSSPMTGTPAAGTYYSNNVITLSPGFSFSATAAQSLNLSIVSDKVPLTTAPTFSQNFIMTMEPHVPGYNPSVASYTTYDAREEIQYLDGLGRPVQTIQIRASATGTSDMVQPVGYDAFGRKAINYLPYAAATADGSYKSDALTTGAGQAKFYSAPTAGISPISTPYAVTAFEASPSNRVIEQGAPGDSWQLTGTTTPSGATPGHTVKTIYSPNDGTKYWAREYSVNIDNSGNRSLVYNGSYPANSLIVTITQNENWNSSQSNSSLNTTEEYKDKQGRVILKRTYNQSDTTVQVLSTYYVFDDLGNLAFVLSPLANADNAGLTSANNQSTLNSLCYQYVYDSRNRVIQKRVPGKDWQSIVYNALDQPVLTQDGNQRVNNQWTATKYDAMQRVVATGIWNAGAVIPLNTLQSNVYAAAQWDARDYTNNITTNPTGYTISSYPGLSAALTINYYDDYTFPGQPGTLSAPAGASLMIHGTLTATKTAVLNTIGNPAPDMLATVYYYDDLGRRTQTYGQHYLGGILSPYNFDIVTNSYNFDNQVIATVRQNYGKNSSNTAAVLNVTINNSFSYDHLGRKTQTYEAISGGPNVLLNQFDYNDIGQVVTKHLHSTNGGGLFAQNINYTYNERGWMLTSIAPLFQMQLQYNNVASVPGITPTAQYNGNIASQSWGSQTAPNTKSYTYTLDNLNRLTGGISTINNTEQGIKYDLNGNITTLQRSGYINDNITYTYMNGGQSNQISMVSDAAGTNAALANGATTYGNFDANGNTLTITASGNPALSRAFTYNLINLPQVVTIAAGTVTYTYDADGNKLRKVSVLNGISTTIDYVDGIQFKNNGVSIDFISTEEGKASFNGSTYDYTYYLGDNLGNTRVTFDTQSGTAAVIQTDDYYPFGLETPATVVSPKNEYLYNKKELQEEIQAYDYGARFYDPAIARWTTVDPLAALNRKWSPYSYAEDSPVKNTDPDGMVTVVGGFGETEDVPASDTWSADGLISFNGQSFSPEAFAQANPGIAKAFNTLNASGKGGVIVNEQAFPVDGMPGVFALLGKYDLSHVVVGYQTALTATLTTGVGASGNIYKQSAMFLGGKYGFYWYDYIGGEVQVVDEFAAEASVGAARSYFIAVNDSKAPAETDTPEGFAGGYKGFGAQGSWKPVLGDVNVGFQWSLSNDHAWKSFSLGASFAVGPSIGAFETFSAGTEAHEGKTRLYPGTKQVPTSQINGFKQAINIAQHSFLNPFD